MSPVGADQPAARSGWAQARNILLVRLDNLGDVLMTTPAIGAVKRGIGDQTGEPHADAALPRLTLLASPAGATVAGHLPDLDDVVVYDAPWVKGPPGNAHADQELLDCLARRRFDAAIIFTVATQSALPAALMCRLAGIPLCLAYSRENPYALLTDSVRDTEVCVDGMRHEVERQLDLVRTVGFDARAERLVFRCHVDETASAGRKLAAAGADPARPYLVVHPGSSAASRRYPAERFGQAAAQVGAESGLQIVFTGGPGEHAQVAAAQAACTRAGAPLAGISPGSTSLPDVSPPDASLANGSLANASLTDASLTDASVTAVSLAGNLSVGELAALIAGASLVLCNNSGPAHLAAAAGTPVVVLYALTNPQHTPWRVASRVLNHDVPCRNCLKSVCPELHHACLLRVTPGAVAEAALELLREVAELDPRGRSVDAFAGAGDSGNRDSAPARPSGRTPVIVLAPDRGAKLAAGR